MTDSLKRSNISILTVFINAILPQAFNLYKTKMSSFKVLKTKAFWKIVSFRLSFIWLRFVFILAKDQE